MQILQEEHQKGVCCCAGSSWVLLQAKLRLEGCRLGLLRARARLCAAGACWQLLSLQGLVGTCEAFIRRTLDLHASERCCRERR